MLGACVRRSHRPPLRVFARCAAEYQPGEQPALGLQALELAKFLMEGTMFVYAAMRDGELGRAAENANDETAIIPRVTEITLSFQADYDPYKLRQTTRIVDLETLWLYIDSLSLEMLYSMELPRRIQKLHLRVKRLHGSSIPGRHLSLRHLRNLTSLTLECADLQELPEDVKHLGQLRVLDVRLYAGTTLPDIFDHLSHLFMLLVFSSQLRELPASLLRSRQLKHLSLYDNQLTSFAFSPEWTALTHLNLSNNPLQGSLCISGALQVLRLNQLNLHEFPECICAIATLNTLYLRGNKIRTIPSALKDMTALEKLDVSENQLAHVPSCLLSRRRWVNVSFNPGLTLEKSLVEEAKRLEMKLIHYDVPILRNKSGNCV